MRILVVEDDSVLAAALTRALNQSAYAVDLVADGEAANDALATTTYDLVVLDIALPKVGQRPRHHARRVTADAAVDQ